MLSISTRVLSELNRLRNNYINSNQYKLSKDIVENKLRTRFDEQVLINYYKYTIHDIHTINQLNELYYNKEDNKDNRDKKGIPGISLSYRPSKL